MPLELDPKKVRDLAKFKQWLPLEFHSLYPDPPVLKRKRADEDREDADEDDDDGDDDDDDDNNDEAS